PVSNASVLRGQNSLSFRPLLSHLGHGLVPSWPLTLSRAHKDSTHPLAYLFFFTYTARAQQAVAPSEPVTGQA
ncbi:hypothetical protein, partial [Paracoccus sp. (in: a-proteobacteria)]|uniref:hypothetical protein n=1 Tax=Paracoccus sp. TaxID=267 RepID=UPI00396CD61C